ncbi:MAG: hypothetical protein A2283_17225 [Lentisphaerae bacterium RIFOXYA12_FULL_48_11]|nr:MAG: hypothetical protein A2283_17225 [Lentisphaerae bacterium RIFOXYA12_FULL_48_11]
MKKLDIRSVLIGMLMTLIAVLGIAAVSDIHIGRYNITMCTGSTPGTLFICIGDTVTGKHSIERCVEQIPETSAMITHIGIYPNPMTSKHSE